MMDNIFKENKISKMKRSNYLYATIIAGALVFSVGCKKDYGNLNSPTVEQFLENAGWNT